MAINGKRTTKLKAKFEIIEGKLNEVIPKQRESFMKWTVLNHAENVEELLFITVPINISLLVDNWPRISSPWSFVYY